MSDFPWEAVLAFPQSPSHEVSCTPCPQHSALCWSDQWLHSVVLLPSLAALSASEPRGVFWFLVGYATLAGGIKRTSVGRFIPQIILPRHLRWLSLRNKWILSALLIWSFPFSRWAVSASSSLLSLGSDWVSFYAVLPSSVLQRSSCACYSWILWSICSECWWVKSGLYYWNQRWTDRKVFRDSW